MPDNHHCSIFRSQEEIDAFREFASWLRNGGMDSLRESQRLSEAFRNAQKIGISALVKSGVTIILALVGWGIAEFIRRVSPL